jgi:hypothetical protein
MNRFYIKDVLLFAVVVFLAGACYRSVGMTEQSDTKPSCVETSCDEHASCDDSGGTPMCTCDAGWTGDGYTCEDIDECLERTANCDSTNGTCRNTEGGYECGCEPGWTLSPDGVTCLGDSAVLEVSTGGEHTCGLKADGTIACWGRNNVGQSTAPPGIFVQVDAGNDHNCGVKRFSRSLAHLLIPQVLRT